MNVLLFANVGTNESGFYHAGDEAMFYQVYRWYRQHFSTAHLTVFSSVPSHPHLQIEEHYGMPWLSRQQFFKLVVKTLKWKLTGQKSLAAFSAPEQHFIQVVSQQDRIHFTGGGNITSLFHHWLYYSLFLIFLGRLLGKEVILSSQTIGPFYGVDRIVVPAVLNLVQEIKIRESGNAKLTLLKLGIFAPKADTMMDAAYDLSDRCKWSLPTVKNTLTIGLSVHNWDQVGPDIQTVVTHLINTLGQRQKVAVLLIPHVFSKRFSGPSQSEDMIFMKAIAKKFSRQVKVIAPSYKDLITPFPEPAVTIKKMSTSVDLLITSRYHGLIFALSGSTPCLAITAGTYYRQKMSQGLKLFYGTDTDIDTYQIDLDARQEYTGNQAKLENLVAHLTAEKKRLRLENRRIKHSLG